MRPKYAGFFLPVKVLSRVFRGKFVAALRRAYARDQLDLSGATEDLRDPARWHAFIDALFQTDWVVYAKPAFGGASAVLRYLGRYTHRVAISNHRLRAFDGERVTFQWKDYAHEDQSRTMTLSAMEFLRRFVQHILPRGFVRIRQSGFLANTCRTARLALARTCSLRRPRPSRRRRRRPTTPPRRRGRVRVRRRHDPRPDPLRAPTDDHHPRIRHLMTATHACPAGPLVDVVTPRLGDRVPRPSDAARTSPQHPLRPRPPCRRCAPPNPPVCAHPDTVEPGL